MKPKQIDFYASERHFADHLAPIYNATPRELRGVFFMLTSMAADAHRLQIDAEIVPRSWDVVRRLRERGNGLVVVAASGNLGTVNRTGRAAVLCQHGAGQSYGIRHSSYAGYPGHKGLALILHPGPYPVQRDAPLYPHIPVLAIGCPRLDEWQNGTRALPNNKKPVVCFSSHWNANIGVPEALGGFDFFKPALARLAAATEYKLVGHAHPRLWKTAVREYERLGIEPVKHFDTVMDTCDLYIMDNSSTMFEFAATGRPVVVLNPPHYRRKASMGIRFWDAAGVGLNCNDPANLPSIVLHALQDHHDVRMARMQALQFVYAYMDGTASMRAVKAIADAAVRVQRDQTIKQDLRIMSAPKKVLMFAQATFANKQHEGNVNRGQLFLTTEARARAIEHPNYQLARRATPNECIAYERRTGNDLPSGEGYVAPGPNMGQIQGSGSGGEFAEEPTQADIIAACQQRAQVQHTGGGWYTLLIDGVEVMSKLKGRHAAEQLATDLIKDDLKRNAQ